MGVAVIEAFITRPRRCLRRQSPAGFVLGVSGIDGSSEIRKARLMLIGPSAAGYGCGIPAAHGLSG
ncbi:MAG: hypothetical protein MZU97_02945 [Bacillus subtilis]|nr:hypothetical protein [Bacillus subtilis]